MSLLVESWVNIVYPINPKPSFLRKPSTRPANWQNNERTISTRESQSLRPRQFLQKRPFERPGPVESRTDLQLRLVSVECVGSELRSTLGIHDAKNILLSQGAVEKWLLQYGKHIYPNIWHGKVPSIRFSCRGMLNFVEDCGLDVKTHKITFDILSLLSELWQDLFPLQSLSLSTIAAILPHAAYD